MKSKNVIKTLSILLICLTILGKAKAQDSTKVEQPTEVKSLNKIRLSLLSLHYEREQKIGKLTTVYGGAGLAGTFLIEYNYNYMVGGKTKTYFDLAPNLYAGIRKYYHFENRIKKGKKTINNASNYFGLDVSSYFSPLIKGGNLNQYNVVNWEIGITPQWGFQRSIGKKTNFELSLGPNMRINKYQTYYGIDGRIGFSFFIINMVQIEQIFPSLTWRIRHEAMYPELPFDTVKLPDDFDGIHFGLYLDHKLTGVVSLFHDGDVYQFRKLAILPDTQNAGYGSQLMDYIIDFCKIQKATKLWCNARVNAKEFYFKFGFHETDKTFFKDGYGFVVMEKQLSS